MLLVLSDLKMQLFAEKRKRMKADCEVIGSRGALCFSAALLLKCLTPLAAVIDRHERKLTMAAADIARLERNVRDHLATNTDSVIELSSTCRRAARALADQEATEVELDVRNGMSILVSSSSADAQTASTVCIAELVSNFGQIRAILIHERTRS